ncbi:MAG: hypothetical protein ACO3JL_16650, partial [Myxococcota bacterium]
MGHTHGFLGPWSLSGALFVASQLASATPQFEHVSSSEWWIELRVVDNPSPTAVTVTPAGATAVAMTPSSHGTWFASFYVPAGSVLSFDAHYADGHVVTSSPFAW